MRVHVYYQVGSDSTGPFRRWECAACGFERLATEWEVKNTDLRVAVCSSGRRLTLLEWAGSVLRKRINLLGRRKDEKRK